MLQIFAPVLAVSIAVASCVRVDEARAQELDPAAAQESLLQEIHGAVAELEQQTFKLYTTLSALQLAGTMVVNPSRLETIEVVGAFALDRAAREIGDEAIKAAIDEGEAKIAVRDEKGDLISFRIDDLESRIDRLEALIEALEQNENAYLLAKSPDLIASNPDFRAIDWNAPRAPQPGG